MRRYLVVAHRTLGGDHLLQELERLRAEQPCRFHLLVPVEHPSDHLWSEGEVNAGARQRLDEGFERLRSIGIIADGEVGDANPVYAIRTVLRREGAEAFDGIVLSTLPRGISRWLRLDVPSRIEREIPHLPLIHVVADREPATH